MNRKPLLFHLLLLFTLLALAACKIEASGERAADAPWQAGPECPEPVANSTIFTNDVSGCCP